MTVSEVASKAAYDEALEHSIVVVDFHASWCGPCKAVAPQVTKFSEAYPSAHFIKLDVDEVPEVAADMGIRSLPTFFVYKKGEKVSQILGTNMQGLKTAIESAVKEENTLVTDEDF